MDAFLRSRTAYISAFIFGGLVALSFLIRFAG
ncbi:hypothetical protein CGLAMM_01170 [Acetobacteraceae bacterium EV16G]|uniref:Uncharacterized protein n=1 Tax=Sorlinia euscelidii TaxID=3081148 RepID=A0ABU7TZ82_9PROT